MMIVKSKKAQIMILDVLILFLIVLLIISLEVKNINSYKTEINNSEMEIKRLEQLINLETIITDSNYLAEYNNNTKKNYKNKIEIKNLNKLDGVCYLSIDGINYLDSRNYTNTYTRGVIYNNNFEILEVGFCEK